MKTCSKCKADKPETEYYKRGSSLQPNCKSCSNEIRKQWARDNKAKMKSHRTYAKYRLRDSDIEKLKEDQNNLCAICPTSLDLVAYHIDHDHSCCPGDTSCGSCVRGLLCPRCNWMIGYYEQTEDILSVLERTKQYLAK